MDKAIAQIVEPVAQFAQDSKFLVRKMSKPDSKGAPSLARTWEN